MQAGFGGAQRDADGGRHLGQRHAKEVMQDDDRAVARIQTREGVLEHVAIGDLAGHVGRGRKIDGRQIDLDDATSPSPDEIEAGMDDQPVQPGVETIRVAQARKVAPGADERVLDRVPCEFGVPDDQPGDRVQPHDGQVDERGEGVMIASPGPLDETSLVHVRLCFGTAFVVVLHTLWRGRPSNRQSGRAIVSGASARGPCSMRAATSLRRTGC